VAVGKVVAQLCLTLIMKELEISVEQDRVVTTLNIIISVDMMFSVNLQFGFTRRHIFLPLM
jgi:hypothetical protein